MEPVRFSFELSLSMQGSSFTSFFEGLGIGIADLAISTNTFFINGMLTSLTAAVFVFTYPSGQTPDWVMHHLTGNVEKAYYILNDPFVIIEGFCESFSDMYEHEGIAYTVGHTVPDVLTIIFWPTLRT